MPLTSENVMLQIYNTGTQAHQIDRNADFMARGSNGYPHRNIIPINE